MALFNNFIGTLLLGGFYCEAVDPSDLERGIFYDTGYFRPFGFSNSSESIVHIALQTKTAGPLFKLKLHKPVTTLSKSLHDAYGKGKIIVEEIDNLSVELILKGVTAFVNRSWSESLSNFWIGIEQIVSFLWKKYIIEGTPQPSFDIKGRNDFLKDTRSWPSSARIEMLYQKEILSDDIYKILNIARKSRNLLIHNGKVPSKKESEAAFDSIFYLISNICNLDTKEIEIILKRFKEMDEITKKEIIPTKTKIPVDEMKNGIWLGPFPPIPGEKEWGDNDYEKVFD